MGAIITPRLLPNLRLSLDYTHIKKTNEITSPTVQDLLNNESLFPSRVTRAPLTPADIAAGYTGGAITAVDISSLNAATTRLEAYDIAADYTWRTARIGDFNFSAVATWEPHFKRQLLPTAPVTEFAGFAPTQGFVKWRGNGGVTWNRGPWTVGWAAQYYGSYYVYTAGSSAATIAAAILNQGSAKIPSQTYHDLLVQYRFDDSDSLSGGYLSGAEISLGIQNIFDTEPPIVATTASVNSNSTGGASIYGDARLRRFTLTLRKRF
jgi:hypothetical protein